MGAWIEISLGLSQFQYVKSHPTMGAWIEIINGVIYSCDLLKSHPTMGAWIEIYLEGYNPNGNVSHPTMGAWIEIDVLLLSLYPPACRTPRWVRGLKFR